MRIFDIIGPVMVGPSSSHTAGAVRIGNVGRKLLGDDVRKAVIEFHGSYLMTGRGHGKYGYKEKNRIEAEIFLREQMKKFLWGEKHVTSVFLACSRHEISISASFTSESSLFSSAFSFSSSSSSTGISGCSVPHDGQNFTFTSISE